MTKTEAKAKERRRHVRVPSGCGMRYMALPEKMLKEIPEKHARHAKDKNISGGGIFIEADEDIPVGTLIGLEISLQKAQSTVFSVGEVVRNEGPDAKGKYGIGVKFLRMSDSDTLEVFNYMVENVMHDVQDA